MKACLSQSTKISEMMTNSTGCSELQVSCGEDQASLEPAHRQNRIDKTLPLDEALGQKGDVGPSHLDHVPQCDDAEHEAELEALHDV